MMLRASKCALVVLTLPVAAMRPFMSVAGTACHQHWYKHISTHALPQQREESCTSVWMEAMNELHVAWKSRAKIHLRQCFAV